MKVLVISNMYPSKSYPSYGVFVKNFIESLDKKDIYVEKTVLTKETNKLKKVIKYLQFYMEIFFKIIIQNYDLIYVHYASHTALPILLASKFKKINLFVNVHGSDVVPQKNSQLRYQKFVYKLLKIAKKVIVPSEYFKKLVENKFNVFSEKIIISPSGGVNQEKFYYINEKSTLRSKYNIDKNLFVIGYVGRIDIGKGWDTFLKSIKILVDNNQINGKMALIVGSGAQISDFKNMISELNLESYIIWRDLLPQNELKNIYNLMDVFCFPTNGESLGLVGLEAMMCGVPVIGSKIGALPEYIIENKTGKLINKFDHAGLSNKILEIQEELTNNEKKMYYTKHCIEKATEYESKKVNDEIYNQITNGIVQLNK